MTKTNDHLVRLREIPRVEVIQAGGCDCSTYKPHAVEAFLAMLTVTGEITAKLEVRLAELGLSRGRFMVLMVLRHADDSASTPAALAYKLSVTTATMTGLLDGLEAASFVRRTHRADDRRSIRVELTAHGRKVLDAFLPGHWEAIGRAMSGLSTTEQQTLTRLLVKLLDARADTSPPPKPLPTARPRRSAAKAKRATRASA